MKRKKKAKAVTAWAVFDDRGLVEFSGTGGEADIYRKKWQAKIYLLSGERIAKVRIVEV